MALTNENTRKLLNQAKLQFEYLIDIIQDILDGQKSQSEVARSMGIIPTNLNHEIKYGFRHTIRKLDILNPEKLKTILIERQTPYEKLIYDIFELDPEQDGLILLDPDFEERLKEIMKTRLKEREQQILELHYGLNGETPHTLTAIAQLQNVSTTRIGDIRQKALRRLRHPYTVKQLLPEYNLTLDTKTEKEIDRISSLINYYTTENEKLNTQLNELQEKLRIEEERYNEFSDENLTEKAIKIANSITEKYKSKINKNPNPIKLDDVYKNPKINMSIRLYNALRRGGCNTLGDVLSHTYEELYRFRNMGQHSMQQLMSILEELGVSDQLQHESD